MSIVATRWLYELGPCYCYNNNLVVPKNYEVVPNNYAAVLNNYEVVSNNSAVVPNNYAVVRSISYTVAQECTA
jgi:hypothetical protein